MNNVPNNQVSQAKKVAKFYQGDKVDVVYDDGAVVVNVNSSDDNYFDQMVAKFDSYQDYQKVGDGVQSGGYAFVQHNDDGSWMDNGKYQDA
jgi:hypothetical protein